MYRYFLRPLLFLFSPETAHRITMTVLRAGGTLPGFRYLLEAVCRVRHPLLEREVFGMKFPNPVGLAAGLDKNAEAYEMFKALGFGFVEVGTVTPKPQPGNPKPRLFRLVKDKALINRMGFNNKGVESVVANLRRKREDTLVGGNLGKNTLTLNEAAPADYLKLFRRLYEYVDYFVINVSCPNINNLSKLQNKESLREILRDIIEFRRGQDLYRPILLKISPDLSFGQIDEAIEVLMECNLDGIVATNTTTSRRGLTTEKALVEYIGNGGLSGRPLTARSVEVVRYVSEKTEGRFPIIGVGGIMTEDEAVAMLEAGASLIQLYTGFIYNGPGLVRRICKRLIREAQRQAPEQTQQA